MEETEYERVAREQREAIEALQKSLMETREGKFVEWCVESLNRFLTKHAPDRLAAWVAWAFWGVAVLVAVLSIIFGGR